MSNNNNKKRRLEHILTEMEIKETESVNKKQKTCDVPRLDANIVNFTAKQYRERFNISEFKARQLQTTVSRFVQQFAQNPGNFLTLQLFRKMLIKAKWTKKKVICIVNDPVFNFTIGNISFGILYQEIKNEECLFIHTPVIPTIIQMNKIKYLQEFNSVKNGPIYKQKWARRNLVSFDYKQSIKIFKRCCICSERKMIDTKLKEEPYRCKQCIAEYKNNSEHNGHYIYRFSSRNNMDPGLQPIWAQGLCISYNH